MYLDKRQCNQGLGPVVENLTGAENLLQTQAVPARSVEQKIHILDKAEYALELNDQRLPGNLVRSRPVSGEKSCEASSNFSHLQPACVIYGTSSTCHAADKAKAISGNDSQLLNKYGESLATESSAKPSPTLCRVPDCSGRGVYRRRA